MLPRNNAAELRVTEGQAFVSLPYSANSTAVDVIEELDMMFIAADQVLYLMRIRHKATQRRANSANYCFKSVHRIAVRTT